MTLRIVPVKRGVAEFNARNLLSFELNGRVKEAATQGATKIVLNNIFGQRYIGTRLFHQDPLEIEVNGTPGNDLGAFLDGHRIVVNGNAQDGLGNTMNNGEIVVHGRAGDILGMSMRGGEIFVRDSVGYRVGIHMKEYGEKQPVIIIGGTSQDFLGEYMAGGTIILLGQHRGSNITHKMRFIGTGMHGGTIYISGNIKNCHLSEQVTVLNLDKKDHNIIDKYVRKYESYFRVSKNNAMDLDFKKIIPVAKRPYGHLYSH